MILKIYPERAISVELMSLRILNIAVDALRSSML